MSLNRDGYALYFSIPRALYAIPILSEVERMTIAHIVNLSSKYVEKGGCNLTNTELAEKHRCEKPTIAHAITKAKWLRIQKGRKDIKRKINERDFYQERKLIFTIPEFWEFFGEVWGELYFTHCEEAKQIQLWLDNIIKNLYNQWCERKKEINNELKQYKKNKIPEELTEKKKSINEEMIDIKYIMDEFYQKFLREDESMHKNFETPPFKKFMTPFQKVYALTFTNNTFTNNTLRNNHKNDCCGKNQDFFPEQKTNRTRQRKSSTPTEKESSTPTEKESSTPTEKESSASEEKKSIGEKKRAKAQNSAPKKSSKNKKEKTLQDLPNYSLNNERILNYYNKLAKSKLGKNTYQIKPNKTIDNLFKKLNWLRNGEIAQKAELIQNGIPNKDFKELSSKEYTQKELKRGIDLYFQALKSGNWPRSKDWLIQLKLSNFLYNEQTNKSHFISFIYYGVQSLNDPTKKLKTKEEQQAYELFQNFFIKHKNNGNYLDHKTEEQIAELVLSLKGQRETYASYWRLRNKEDVGFMGTLDPATLKGLVYNYIEFLNGELPTDFQPNESLTPNGLKIGGYAWKEFARAFQLKFSVDVIKGPIMND